MSCKFALNLLFFTFEVPFLRFLRILLVVVAAHIAHDVVVVANVDQWGVVEMEVDVIL